MTRYFFVQLKKLVRIALSATLVLGVMVFVYAPNAHAEMSFADAGQQFQETNLESNTMQTEDFDQILLDEHGDVDWQEFFCGDTVVTDFGTFDCTPGFDGEHLRAYSANRYGGANGTGNYVTGIDTTLSLNATQRYVGFWWSAGNAANFVEIQDVDGNVLESYSTQTLIDNLGTCPESDYCDNPNPGSQDWNDPNTDELYAYVHIRFEAGFRKVRFSGQGFEFDNVSVSETVPARVATETTVSSNVRTDCSAINSTDATNETVACPRTITISTGTASEYNPLTESQISGYSYPNSVELTNSDINDGVGEESRNGNVITLSSTTVGTFTVNFTIRNSETGGTDTSRITVNVETVTARLPSILHVDPQEVSKKLPIPSISGGTNITLCTSQVSDGSGSALGSSNTIEVVRSSETSGVTRGSGNNLVTYSGTQANINNQLSTLSIQGVSNAVVVNGASKFLRIVVTPTSSAVSNQCATGVSQNIEIKPLELGKTRLVDVAVS